jgi:hypothetical protein
LGETWEAAGLTRCNLHKKISAGKAVKLYKKPFFSDYFFAFLHPACTYTPLKKI